MNPNTTVYFMAERANQANIEWAAARGWKARQAADARAARAAEATNDRPVAPFRSALRALANAVALSTKAPVRARRAN